MGVIEDTRLSIFLLFEMRAILLGVGRCYGSFIKIPWLFGIISEFDRFLLKLHALIIRGINMIG
jgi:hypothetical protein